MSSTVWRPPRDHFQDANTIRLIRRYSRARALETRGVTLLVQPSHIVARSRLVTWERRLAAVALLLVILCAPAAARAAEPALYWGAPAFVDLAEVHALSCPSTSLCVGVDDVGNVVASASPTEGAAAWSVAKGVGGTEPEPLGMAPNALDGVSCTTGVSPLCVVVGEKGIFTSTDPTGGTNAWVLAIGGAWHAVSCPSESLCIAGSGGQIAISTDPAGGAGAWHETPVKGAGLITGLSCPSEHACVGVDESGDVLTSEDPAGGEGAWSVTHIGGGGLSSVSCASASLCVAGGGSRVLSSADPGGGASAWVWQEGLRTAGGSGQVACTSPSLCVVSELDSGVAESIDPTGGGQAWSGIGDLDGTEGIESVACTPESICFAAGVAVVVGVPAHTMTVSLHGLGKGEVDSSPMVCPFGCTYSGTVCPYGCGGRSSNAFVPTRVGAIACITSEKSGGEPWGNCSLSYPSQDIVTLTATPQSGSTFTGWNGACSGASPTCEVPMSAARVVSASFGIAAASTTGPPSGNPQPAQTPLRLSHFTELHATWADQAISAEKDKRSRHAPSGTIFTFDLNRPASVDLSVTRSASGHMHDGKCVTHAHSSHTKPQCASRKALGALHLSGRAGINTVHFDGALGGRRLTPGKYSLRITATASGEHTTAGPLSFTIVRA